MKYKEVPEPHRSLLFQLVEVYREHAEPTSGGIPFQEYGPACKLMLYDQLLDRYSSSNLHFLEKLGYLTIQPWRIDGVDCIGLRKEALDYYDYMQSPSWRRWISDVWEKTEKHWMSLLFGLLGGIVFELIARLFH